MKSDPLVSVVTPVLNRGSTILGCLRSVDQQAYRNVEHIIVDGGSTDGTLEVIESFKSALGLRVVSEPDRGMYDAVNKGLQLARGQIVSYLNSDDMYLPWSVDTSVRALSKGADFVFGDLALLLEDHRGERSFELSFYRQFEAAYYVHLRTIAQPTVFWRRSFLDTLGRFDEEYRFIADCDYWARAAGAGARFIHVDEITAVQVDHPEMLRALHAAEVEREFQSLRETYRSTRPSVLRQRLEGLNRRILWRCKLLAFYVQTRRSNPKRWKNFIGFIRAHNLPIEGRELMLFLLPQRMRPANVRFLDETQLVQELLRPTGAPG